MTRRVLEAVGRVGFTGEGAFRRYLEQRTVRDDGTTWTLVEMARELGVPAPIFLGYHARVIDEMQRGARS